MANVIEEFIKKKKMDEAAKDAGIKKGETMEEKDKKTPEGQEGQENSGADMPQKESKKGKVLGFVKKAGGYALAGLAGAVAVVFFAVTRKDDDPDETDDDSDEEEEASEDADE